MAQPLRVLVLNLTAEMGGAERSLLGLARGIDRARFALTLVVPAEGPLTAAFRQAGHEAMIDGVAKLPSRSPLAAAVLLRKLLEEVRARGIRLIHSNGIWRLNRAAALSLLMRVPAICHVRDLDPSVLGSWRFRAASRRMKKLVAISHGAHDTLVRAGVPGSKVETIYNGIDLDLFRPAAVSEWMRRDWGIPKGAFLIGVVGQIEPRKGQIEFLAAARVAAAADPAVHFVVIGGDIHGIYGDYRRELEREVTRSDLWDRVTFAGIVEDIAGAMGALDALVVPSGSEPFGRVAVEAMAARRAVVAYRTAGLGEIVEEEVTGLTVHTGDTRALAAAMVRLAGNRSLAVEMGERGRERAERLFGIEAHVKAMERLYEESR